MIRWLKDGKGDWHDQPVKLYSNLELMVTRGGNVDFEPGSRKLYQVILDEFRARRRDGHRLPPPVRVPAAGFVPETRIVSQSERKEFRVEEIAYESEPGVPVSGRLYVPPGAGRKPAVVIYEEKRLRVPLFVQPSQSTAVSPSGSLDALRPALRK